MRMHLLKNKGAIFNQKYPRWVLPLGIGILGFLAVLLLRPPSKPASQAGKVPPSVPIITATAHIGNLDHFVDALGTVTPFYTVSVTSRVLGQVMKVNYQEGQMVKKGDSLVEIDSRPYEAAVNQMEGQLYRDQASLRQAQIDVRRYRLAYAKRAIQKQLLDDQEQIVHQYEGAVKADLGALESARINLQYCHITAPIDGRVGLRLIDPGNLVLANAANPLVVLTQIQPITVIFSIAQDYLPQLQEQVQAKQSLRVDVFNRTLDKKLTAGTLHAFDNVIDTSTGTIRLRAIFDNQDGKLFPNQFVNIKLLLNTEHDATLVPTAAIQRGPQGTFVYIINSQQIAEIRPVQVGLSSPTMTAVEGISAHETVAIQGFDKLKDGSKVSVQEQQEVASLNQEPRP